MDVQSVCRFSRQCPTSVAKISAKHSSAKGGDADNFFQNENFGIYKLVILKGNIFLLNCRNYVESILGLLCYAQRKVFLMSLEVQ